MSQGVNSVALAAVLALISTIIAFRLKLVRILPRIVSDDELRDAAERQETLLLVVVGETFDVTSGREYYGRQASGLSDSYEGFANGTDASRAFLTADFVNNGTDNLSDLSPGECLGVEHWRRFYHNHSTYKFVGLHHGRFYNASGAPTDAHAAFRACVARGEHARAIARAIAIGAPRCQQRTPSGELRFDFGTWHAYACDAPLRPRRLLLDGQLTCVCLTEGAASDYGSCGGVDDAREPLDAAALGMEDDQELPHVYADCEPRASSCVARVA